MQSNMKRLGFVVLAAALAAAGGRETARAAELTIGKPVAAGNQANDPTRPVPGQVRWFMRNHASYVAQTKSRKIELCLLGDSIMALWPGDLFKKYFGKYQAVNFGVGGDKIQYALWRLEHGELAGTAPRVIVLLIGINNMGVNSSDEIAYGIAYFVNYLRAHFPQTKVLLLGLFPTKGHDQEKIVAVNRLIAKLDDGQMVRFLNLHDKFLDKDGKLPAGLLQDAVHPAPKGYEIWGDGMAPLLAQMMGS